MIPNIFISSSIEDLHYLREMVRDLISSLGYNPIMSEHGDIGYVPDKSVENACYSTAATSQLGILIIGKRYGTVSSNGLGIVHNEFHKMRERKIPIICLIDGAVMSNKETYNTNRGNTQLKFKGMDNPEKTFEMIDEFIGFDLNNGFLKFKDGSEACDQLRKQIALIFGDLLSRKFDPLKGEVKDILSEIKTLRHELLKNDTETYLPFLTATRFLLDEDNSMLEMIVESVYGTVENSISHITEAKSFLEYIKSASWSIQIVKSVDRNDLKSKLRRSSIHQNSKGEFHIGIGMRKVVYLNKAAELELSKKYDKLKKRMRECTDQTKLKND